MPSAPEAGNTTETLAPKNVLDTPSAPAVEPSAVETPATPASPATVTNEAILEARIGNLEFQVQLLTDRIAHFNGRSSQKI